MIHSLHGILADTRTSYCVVSCGGIGLKVLVSARTSAQLPPRGSEVSLMTFFYVREDRFELYGFPDEESVVLFEMFNTVSGVGPKTALGILDLDTVPRLTAAIVERRVDMLTRASGIGKKTAERIVLELNAKLASQQSAETVAGMDAEHDVRDVLIGLGYRKSDIDRALIGGVSSGESTETLLKRALKALGTRGAQ